VALVFSVISLISSLIVVFFYCAYHQIRRKFFSLLIFILASLDILCWLNVIVSAPYYLYTGGNDINCFNKGFCVFLGFMWSLSELLNFGVTFLISLSLYLALMKNTDPAQYKYHMLLSVFVISFIFALMPFWFPADDDLVYDGNLTSIGFGPIDEFRCWITNREARITSFYGPLWVVMILNITIMIFFLRGLPNQKGFRLQRHYQARFTLFPMIMLVSYIVPSIRRIIQFSTQKDDTNFSLDLFMYILMPMQGLFNTIVFGLFKEFIRVRMAKT